MRRMLLPLVVGGLLTVALLGGNAAGGALWPSQHTAHAQTPDNPALLRELAQRLLSFPSADPTAQAQLFPGALPPDLVFTPPLPPGSQLIGSATLPPPYPNAGARTDIVADTTSTPDDVLSFYQTTLTGQGWTAPANGFRPGGFLPTAPIPVSSFCQGPSGPSLTVIVRPQPSGPNDLRLEIVDSDPNRCNPQLGPGPIGPFTGDLLPALAPPDGVTIQGSSFGGDGASQITTATAHTTLALPDLDQDYEQQLVAAGWTRIDGGGSDTFVWSSWTVPGDTPRQGLLTAWAAGDGDRQLELRVVTPGASSGTGSTTVTIAPAPGSVPTP